MTCKTEPTDVESDIDSLVNDTSNLHLEVTLTYWRDDDLRALIPQSTFPTDFTIQYFGN